MGFERQLQAGLFGADAHHRYHLIQQFGQTGFFRQHLHFPGLDFGQLQNVVNQGEQVISGCVDDLDVALLLLRQGMILGHDLRETDHRIEWGAQFMAHIGQEGGF